MNSHIALPLLLATVMSFTNTIVLADTGKNLRQAAQAGNFEAVRNLLVKGIDANAAGRKGGTPLIKAAKEGHLSIAQLLLFHGGDPNLQNKGGRSALEVAERRGHDDIASVMTEGIKEQKIQIPYREMELKEFVSLMKGVFLGRNYRITSIESGQVTAAYKRSERLYIVKASMQKDIITLQFLRGYGARKTNYLLNLKKDLMRWEMNRIN